MLNKTETWNDINFLKIEDRVRFRTCFKYQTPGQKNCSCGRSRSRQNNGSTVDSLGASRVFTEFDVVDIQQNQKNPGKHEITGFRKVTKLRNDRGALLRGRAVSHAPARTRIRAVRHGRICQNSKMTHGFTLLLLTNGLASETCTRSCNPTKEDAASRPKNTLNVNKLYSGKTSK